MLLPSFNDIRYFLEVAETNNISRAAERLGISQPSLSLAIKRVEDAVGTNLVVRSKAGVQLNPSGKRFVAEARTILNQWEHIKAKTLQSDTEVSGQYIIGAHPSVCMYSLPHFLPELLKENPLLEIHLSHDLSRKVTEEVISSRIDIGIAVNPVSHPDLVIKELCTDKVTLWTSSKPSANQDIKKGNAVLINDPALTQTQDLLKKLAKKKLTFARQTQSSNLEVIASLTAAGAGIGILPSRVATKIKSHGLKPLMKDAPFFSDKICLVYRADSQKTLTFKAIIDSIKAVF